MQRLTARLAASWAAQHALAGDAVRVATLGLNVTRTVLESRLHARCWSRPFPAALPASLTACRCMTS